MKKTYVNIVMFIVGLILLAISYRYIQNNPAEKQWLISSYETMKQKVISTKEQIIDSNGEIYKQKIQLISNYQEIQNTIINSTNPKCKELDTNILTAKITELQSLNTKEYQINQTNYLDFILDYKNRIDINCK